MAVTLLLLTMTLAVFIQVLLLFSGGLPQEHRARMQKATTVVLLVCIVAITGYIEP